MRLILFACILALPSVSIATTLFDFNSGSGQTLPGWTYYDGDPDGADDYNRPGWRKDDGQFWSGGTNWLPRIVSKGDYAGTSTLQEISTTERAPSTSTGGSMRVYDGPASTYNGAGQWINFVPNLSGYGYADANTDRLSFYIKLNGLNARNTGTYPATNFHVGTYTCWSPDYNCSNSYQNHWYHYFSFSGGAWLKVEMDQHPTHRVGGTASTEPIDDPIFASLGKHYYETLTWMYFEIRNSQTQPTEFFLDEMVLRDHPTTENVDSIANPWIGYWPGSGKWEVGFNDQSVQVGTYVKTSFEIRWSASPITNENWDSANTITPEYWRVGATNKFQRSTTGYLGVWTRFDLPAGTEDANAKVYFAIKDVSEVANGDYHDAPTNLIRTIDYDISPSGAPADTTAPTCSAWSLQSPVTSLTIPVTALDCSDLVGVTEYYWSESPTTPTAGSSWLSSAPTSVIAGGTGNRVFYLWARDAAGNISQGRFTGAVVSITQPAGVRLNISQSLNGAIE